MFISLNGHLFHCQILNHPLQNRKFHWFIKVNNWTWQRYKEKYQFSFFNLWKKVCLGLRWLRGQDKDSIGEDDRRGAAGPAGGQPADTNHRFGRGPRRAQTRDQHRQVMAEQQLLPAGEQHPAMLATKCTRADIVTHLGNTKKLQFQQNHQHVEKIGWTRESFPANPLWVVQTRKEKQNRADPSKVTQSMLPGRFPHLKGKTKKQEISFSVRFLKRVLIFQCLCLFMVVTAALTQRSHPFFAVFLTVHVRNVH